MMTFYISRFKGMEQKEFEVEVVTPLFLGGADPKKTELRAPSIKGALRFWWRTLYGSSDIVKMKERETKIFGSTKEKASFSLQIKNTDSAKPVLMDLPQGKKVKTQSRGKSFDISIIEYLAYGLYEYDKAKRKNVYTKEFIAPETTFTLIIQIQNTVYTNEILDPLKMLCTYGGLGARSRNGFGAISIKEMISIKADGNLRPFTSVSSQSVLFNHFSEHDKWQSALSEIGTVYREARNSLEKKHSFAKRPLIAKPLITKEVKINERHAKPYFLHVNKLQNDKYKGQILFMPYKYYDQSKQKEYLQTCKEMNQKIFELTGGQK